MILSETIEVIHSNLINQSVFSEEDPDYRVPEQELRLLEDEGARNLEDNENKRLLE